jgi:hypothetical protein
MSGDVERDHVVSQGALQNGQVRVDYYTTNPAPSQWVAIGVITAPAEQRTPESGRKLLVGNGANELESMLDLHVQFLGLVSDSDLDTPAADDHPRYKRQSDRRASSGIITDPRHSPDNEPSGAHAPAM